METQTSPIQETTPDISRLSGMNQTELIEFLKQQIENEPINTLKETVDVVKQLFYRIQQSSIVETVENEEVEAVNNSDDDENNDNADNEAKNKAIAERKAIEEAFKGVLSIYREKKAEYNAAIEAEQNKNLEAKRNIIVKLEELTKTDADLSEKINNFRTLQNEWREIGQVPQANINDIWKEYNYYQEQFYDLIKINSALREYDFKKNLEAKTSLIEQAEALQNEEDVVKAFQQLQLLHNQWREIGPVERELREEIWNKFKELSSQINKRHQDYFVGIKEEEARLTQERENLCAAIESIDFTTLTTYKDWDEKSQEVISYNEFFKSNTPVERRVNARMFKRYRKACDMFFEAKSQFYKAIKETFNQNYEKKRRLVEQAEQLKNSTEWKSTTDKLIEMQKEWKTIGPVPKKNSDAIWQRFTAACDHFFARKEENFKSKKVEEQENLRLKLEAIEAINNYVFVENDEEDYSALRRLSDQFLAIGHIPYKEKDRIYNAYREATNTQFGKLRSKRRTAQLSFAGDRNKLMRQYDILKQQIATYENNIGFFSNNRKSNAMVKELEHKIENLKQDLSIIIEQLKATEENK